MQPREEVKREPQKAPDVTKEQPKLKRFRIVKLEERIAPLSGGGTSDYCAYSVYGTRLCTR